MTSIGDCPYAQGMRHNKVRIGSMFRAYTDKYTPDLAWTLEGEFGVFSEEKFIRRLHKIYENKKLNRGVFKPNFAYRDAA